MKPQMNRQQYLIIAEQLLECTIASMDVLTTLVDVYIRANDCFDERVNDIDPSTIAAGVQAQYLGIRTLAQWLEAISRLTSSLYYLRGQECVKEADELLDKIGVVVPDVMRL